MLAQFKLGKSTVFYLFAAPFALLTIVMGLWPIALSIQTSFTDSYTALSPDPVYVGLSNYIKIFNDPVFLKSAWLTLRLSLIHISEPTRPPLLSRMPSSA